jgi:hypothetical protein
MVLVLMDSTAAAWTRETPWRQGHVLPADAVVALNLLHPDFPESTCVVIISHDCDLASADLHAEPGIEVIVGSHPEKTNGNFSWGKAPRTLHLDVIRDGAEVAVELTAPAKQTIRKLDLAPFSPDPAYEFSGISLSTLRVWLAVRYNRVAFPDEFVNRFNRAKLGKALEKLLEPVGKSLSAVYFDVDSGQEVDRSDGSAFKLKIVLAYPGGRNPEQSADEMDALAESIDSLFHKLCFETKTETWNGIALAACMAISEDDLTVSQSRMLRQWRFEHMSLRAGDAVE